MSFSRTLFRTLRVAAPLAAALLLAGCAVGSTAYRRGDEAAKRGNWDGAVLDYAKAAAQNPQSPRYKLALAQAKLRASTAHFDRAKQYVKAGQEELALKELEETIILDPGNTYAANELARVQGEIERRRRAPSAMDRARSAAERRAETLGPPKLDPKSNVRLALRFPDATVGEVYETLSKTSGINFLYDDKLDLKKKISVDLSNLTFDKALDVLMLMNRHSYKVVDDHSILVYEDSVQKHKEHDDLVIRTFYLSNAETQEIQTLLRQLLEMRRLAENKNLNAITVRDTPDRIKVAERIVKANDKSKGEILVDIELLELDRATEQKLGFDLTSKSLALTFGDGKQSVPLNNLDRLRQSGAWSVGPIPSVTLDFLHSDSDNKTIARPQLRILEGDTGKITIGDRVPIPSTSYNINQTVGSNIVPITSYTYQNVGIIVEVKPRVHHNKEVTLDLKVEVSSIAGYVTQSNGPSQPIIGTRSVETTIRLQDGETNMLAGLIKEEDQKSLSGVPGLSQIPLLKRIFGSTDDQAKSTDIVLSITPHIVRTPNIEPIDLAPLWVGSEDNVQLRGVARNALGESPFSTTNVPWDEIDRELFGDRPAAEEAKPEERPEAKDAAKPGAKTETKNGGRTAAKEAAKPEAADAAKSGAATTPATVAPKPSSPAPVPVQTPGAPAAVPVDAGAAPPPTPETPAATTPAAETTKPRTVADVWLQPEATRVAAGDAVAVDVMVGSADNAGAVNFQLRYDPAVLQFAPPAEPGDFLEQGGTPVDLQVVEGAEGGLVVLSAARMGRTGATGGGRVARLMFVAIAPGSANFSFASGQVRGVDGTPQQASFREAAVEVSP